MDIPMKGMLPDLIYYDLVLVTKINHNVFLL